MANWPWAVCDVFRAVNMHVSCAQVNVCSGIGRNAAYVCIETAGRA